MSVALTLASALLLTVALPNEFLPWGATLPGLVALAPILIAVYRTPDRRAASRLGLLFGVVSTAAANYWLAFFGEFSVWTIGGTVLGYAGYNYILFGYLHYLAHDGGARAITAGRGLRPLWIALAWTGYEYLKSVGFLGYPWGLVAYPLARIETVAQVAELAGVWGLSFLAALANTAIAEFWAPDRPATVDRRDAVRALSAATLLIVVAAGFGLWRLPTIRPREERSMLLVQQNVDSWQPGRFPDALARAQDLTINGIVAADGAPIDAVVWSETALRRPYDPEAGFYHEEPQELPFRLFLDLIDAPLVTGAPMPAGPDGRDATNSALVIASDGRILGQYGKQQLVPFAESIPFWDVPAVQRFFREVIGLYGTWVPGTGSEPIPIPLADGTTLRAGTPICFEDAFGWVPREMVREGAELLVNLTNNSWSRRESAQIQHYVAARLRAIELRTTLVRGTNSGLSTVVDARGRRHDTMPMFTGAVRRVSVPIYEPQWTLYRAWGDWLGILAAVLTLLRVVIVAGTTKKDHPSGRPFRTGSSV